MNIRSNSSYSQVWIALLIFIIWGSASVGWCESNLAVSIKKQHIVYVNQYIKMMKLEAQSGAAQKYYNTSYFLNGMISAVEATNDENELLKLIDLIDTMISKAKDLNGDGMLEWGADNPSSAPLDPNNRPWQLYSFQAAVPIARTAAYLLTNSQFKISYGVKASQYAEFVDKNILRYWFDKDIGVYKVPTTSSWGFVAGTIPWADKVEGGTGEAAAWDDKASLAGTLAAALYSGTKDPFHKDIAERIGRSFKKRLTVVKNSWIWDSNLPMSYWVNKYGYDASDYEPAHDTSHSNREPAMMVLMYEAGLVFTIDDLNRMANTLLEMIWNGSLNNPVFSNYINGSNKPYIGTRLRGGVGNVYAGWCMLGRYSSKLQKVMQATLNALKDGKKIGQNNSPYGLVSLTGHLLRNGL